MKQRLANFKRGHVNWFIIMIGLLQICAAFTQFKSDSPLATKLGVVYLMYAIPNFILATIK